MLIIHKPLPSELSEYYQTYLKYVSENNLLEALLNQKKDSEIFLSAIPENKEGYAYANDKWMLKEVVGHLCDTERILTYRALRISRNDQTPLPGFEENEYTLNSNYRIRSLANIADEFKAVGASTIKLFYNMSEEMFNRTGTANQTRVSVKAILFFIVAHERHHLNVIRERYLSS
jgi:hypothetical protein